MSYSDSVNYLYSLQKYGVKLGLANTATLLAFLDNPHNSFKAIHVAGTNGKGSTSAMIAAILQAAGFKVGLFTSPHLVSFTERIRVNDKEITEHEVIELTEQIREAALKIKNFSPTFFEFVTAMAFLYFKREDVEWAVIETGMGGRLDATNVIVPEVSVITNIGYDHKEFLGDTISAIAGEKAGIIKDGVVVVCAMQDKEAEDIICKASEMKLSPLFIYGKDFSGVLRSSDLKGIIFDYTDDTYTINNLFVPLAGEYQLFNACLAIKSAIIALQNSGANISSELQHFQTAAIREGLASARWHGRLELISDNPPILIDGAHNPAAAAALSDALRKNFSTVYEKIILILGIMADKDIKGIMGPILPLAAEIIFTAPSYDRAATPEVLAGHASEMGFSRVHTAGTVKDALEMAIAKTGIRVQEAGGGTNPNPQAPKPLILITGSFYTIGEAKEALGGKGILSRLRETR